MTVQTKAYQIKKVISTSKRGDKAQIVTLHNTTKHVVRLGEFRPHATSHTWIDADNLYYEF
jgi:hypothetical protein